VVVSVDVSYDEAIAELEHSITELRAGREAPPWWLTVDACIADLESQLANIKLLKRGQGVCACGRDADPHRGTCDVCALDNLGG
jgi:hypothetical protein